MSNLQDRERRELLAELQGFNSESWVVGRVVGRGSWVVGRGSWVVGRGSWVVGRGSCRGSWVYGSCKIYLFCTFKH